MSHLILTRVQLERRAKYASGEIKVKPLTHSSIEEQIEASKQVVDESLREDTVLEFE